MASRTFMTFRGVPDALVEYKVTGDPFGLGPDAGEIEWWFGPEDTARFSDVTPEEDEAISLWIAKVWADDCEMLEG